MKIVLVIFTLVPLFLFAEVTDIDVEYGDQDSSLNEVASDSADDIGDEDSVDSQTEISDSDNAPEIESDRDVAAGTVTTELVIENEPAPLPPSVIAPVLSIVTGKMVERGTRRPLKDTTFYIKGNDATIPLMTDKEGKFELKLVPGWYRILAPVVGYEKLEERIWVKKGEKLDLTLRMDSLVINPYEIVVRTKKPKSEVSVQRVTVQEAVSTPGANRDVLKVITSMPGVNSLSVFNGYGSGLVIRGSGPEDSMYHVNDHWVPQLYHFGGMESIIEPEMVESIDFYAGGFSPEYAEATGGVIKVNIRDPRKDRFGGYANLSLLSSSVMVEGPITDKDSISFSIKRGFLDLYMKLLSSTTEMGDMANFTTYPTYYDTMTVYTHEFSKRSKLKVIAIGSTDSMKMKFDSEAEAAGFSDTLKYGSHFGEVITEWHYKNKGFKSVLSPMVMYSHNKISIGPRANIEMNNYQFSLSEKAEYKIGKSHTLVGAMRVVPGYFKMDSNFYAPPKEGEVGYNPFEEEIEDHNGQAYLMGGISLMDRIKIGKFLVTPGALVTYVHDEFNDSYYVDPRLSVRYSPFKWLRFKAATGLYSKFASFDERMPPWGKAGIDPERSVHFIGGVEADLTDNLFLDVQGYYKHFFDMVVRGDKGASDYINEGKGYAYGAEVLLRHNMTDNFFGWVSYSFGVSKRKDGSGKDWRYFDMDIPHNLTLVASYKPNRYWQFGARFSYVSGKPFTDLTDVETMYDADNNSYTPIYEGSINEDRMPARHQLDVRIDKYWIFDNWILSTYVDVQNAYFRKNALDVVYNDDYTEKKNMTSIPIMVFLGFKGDF